MADELYISHDQAVFLLIRDGDYSKYQAEIILGHSLKKQMNGGLYYPLSYISKRAEQGATRAN